MTRDHETPSDHTEELLTAYALGECTAAERATVDRLLAGDDADAVARDLDELRRIAEALRTPGDNLPTRSPDLRRSVVASLAASVTAAPAPPQGRGRLAWIVAGATGLAATLMLAFLPQRHQALAPRDVAHRPDGVQRVAAGHPVVATVPPPSVPPPVMPSPETATPPAKPNSRGRQRVSWESTARQPGIALEPVAPTAAGSGQFVASTRQRDLERSQQILSLDEVARLARRREQSVVPPPAAREQYDQFTESRFVHTAEEPLSTFSIDVDTASYANVRRFLMAGSRPPRDAVRIEELVNYFGYGYPEPEGDDPFSVTVEAAECPWRRGHRLVRIGLKGRDVARDARPAGNLVFLVDVSGSMGDPDKLPLVKQALLLLVEELTENDRVAIVTYAGAAGLKLPPTSGDRKETIRAAIESLASGGSTHGSAGIELAYQQAAERFIPGGANRVILATDGDLNVGITDDAALVDLITKKARGGTFLTVLGFGQGNLQDEKMEKLADNGNGVYAYIDGVREARKVLVEQLTGSTIAIAKDVKIQVEFNPAVVSSYRLIGYENRALANEDFRDDTKDAGEIGAGHGVTALYEVALEGAGAASGPGRGAEPLKYRRKETPPVAESAPSDEAASRELLTVKLRYKEPDGSTSRLVEQPLADGGESFEAASADLRFASAVAAFGMILRGGEHLGDATLPMVARIAAAALGPDAGGYRAEFLDLVRRAESAQ
jgi:secreted protein with Ig-like and vWFA domain